MSKILVLSNQKGGVGKSTLAVLLANHLAAAGKSIGVIELDVQKSILGKRKVDVDTFGEEGLLYEVRYQQPNTMAASNELVSKLKGVKDDCLFIIDLPGKIDDELLVPFLVSADFILCPFQYEAMCLESTTTFLKVMRKLTGRFRTNPQIIFCPNNIDARIGTKREIESWQQVDQAMSQFGIVVPRIPSSADMRRLNTFENTSRQSEIAARFLNAIDSIIKVKKSEK